MAILGLVLIIFLVIGALFFWNEVSAFANDVITFIKITAGDNEIKIPTPQRGTTVCDLFVTVQIRSISAVSGSLIPTTTERILFSDGQQGRLIGWDWDNCHQYGGGFLSLAPFDLLSETQFNTLEFFIPASNFQDQKVILSFTLVDRNGLEKKLPVYQRVTYVHPAFVTDFDFEQKLKFRDLTPNDYTLKIIPDEAHFDNKKVGEPLTKPITYP